MQVQIIHLKHGDFSLCHLHIPLFVSLIYFPQAVSTLAVQIPGALSLCKSRIGQVTGLILIGRVASVVERISRGVELYGCSVGTATKMELCRTLTGTSDDTTREEVDPRGGREE